ncbi:MAG: hypothetical protein ICCCNLDF_00555 [Planctomycetes bacterium]|nr:hypothetical protein [Planctomycetota bacterium]
MTGAYQPASTTASIRSLTPLSLSIKLTTKGAMGTARALSYGSKEATWIMRRNRSTMTKNYASPPVRRPTLGQLRTSFALVALALFACGCSTVYNRTDTSRGEIDGLFGRPALRVVQHQRPPSMDIAVIEQVDVENVLSVLAEHEFVRHSRIVPAYGGAADTPQFRTPVGSPYVWESPSGSVVLYVGPSAQGDYRIAETNRPFELVIDLDLGLHVRRILERQ